jgi:DNA-binding transcriptional regulator GbsR (MarR family)
MNSPTNPGRADHKLSEAEQNFIERMGLNSEADGHARITGRVWGLLMVLGVPLTSAEIAELLQVSRGSVSTNLKMLEMMSIIERRTKPGEREIYFAMCDQPYSALVRGFLDRFATYRRQIESAQKAIDRPEAQQRLEDLKTFYAAMETAHRAILDQIQDKE